MMMYQRVFIFSSFFFITFSILNSDWIVCRGSYSRIGTVISLSLRTFSITKTSSVQCGIQLFRQYIVEVWDLEISFQVFCVKFSIKIDTFTWFGINWLYFYCSMSIAGFFSVMLEVYWSTHFLMSILFFKILINCPGSNKSFSNY